MNIALVIGIRVGCVRGPTQTRDLADTALITLPEGARPHERLVIKAGRQQAANQIVNGINIVFHTGPTIDRLSLEPFIEFHLRRTQSRHCLAPFAHLENSVRFFSPNPNNASRTVILETPRHSTNTIGDQCGC